MRKRLAAIVATVTLVSTPAMALAGQPVRSSDAVVSPNGTAVSKGTTAGRQVATTRGVSAGAGAGGGGMSTVALAGLGLGLTGVALATYIALNKSASPR